MQAAQTHVDLINGSCATCKRRDKLPAIRQAGANQQNETALRKTLTLTTGSELSLETPLVAAFRLPRLPVVSPRIARARFEIECFRPTYR